MLDAGPMYIGLVADSDNYMKNLFQWDKPLGQYILVDFITFYITFEKTVITARGHMQPLILNCT